MLHGGRSRRLVLVLQEINKFLCKSKLSLLRGVPASRVNRELVKSWGIYEGVIACNPALEPWIASVVVGFRSSLYTLCIIHIASN